MYNTEALQHSRAVLEEQKQFLLETRPYIKQLADIDSIKNQKADYMYSVDNIAICSDGTTETVQFKNRNAGNNDFILMAKKLSGKAANEGKIGFWYKGVKYVLMPAADIYVENINGMNYAITRNEINTIETWLGNCEKTTEIISGIQPEYHYKDDGTRFPTGDFYVFITLAKLADILSRIYGFGNPNLFN